MSNKNRVAIYIRVSTTYQKDKDSLPMQRKDLVSYCNLILNTDDYVIFEDAGYSGKNTDRPNYQEMMLQVRHGLFTHILVWKIDRISRNLLDFSTMYKELKELGVTFVSKSEQFDTSSAMGEAMLKIILVFAELERNMTSERVTATMISRANSGQWNGGRVPYGYEYNKDSKTFSINDNEAQTVVLIHDKYEEMCSLVKLSKYMNELGLRTRSGNLWNPISVRIILCNVFYCGDYRYNVLKEGNRQKKKDQSEWVTIENHHPSIVNREQKERVINILCSNNRNHIRNYTKNIHIFQGLIICGSCGKTMVSYIASKSKKWIYSNYACNTRRNLKSNTDCKYTSDSIVGEFVFNFVLNVLNAQSSSADINSIQELQDRLLLGDTFSNISKIEDTCLEDMLLMLKSDNTDNILYGKTPYNSLSDSKNEVNTLRQRKQSVERAIDRLTSLYLYSDNALSEAEFIIQKTKLTNELDEIDEQIGFINSDPWEQSLTDEVFIKRASEFIIANKLSGRKYVNFRRLSETVDREVLQSFVRGIILSVTVESGRIKKIVFKNGLTSIFLYN